MRAKYKSLDERVLSHIVDRAKSGELYISRTSARYGLLSVSAEEFDSVLDRFKIDVTYNDNRGQQYEVAQVVKALASLQLIYQKINESPWIFEKDPDGEVQ